MPVEEPHARITPDAIAKDDLLPIVASPWWEKAARLFSAAMGQGRGSRPLILYGADADGFAASYYAERILASAQQTASRAVWNADYDFAWLPGDLEEAGIGLLACFDVPLMREFDVVRELACDHPIAIYDHHMVGEAESVEIPGVVYLNSRVLDKHGANYPASAFAAAFAAEELGALAPAELLVVAVGLIGDRADRRHPELFDFLERSWPGVQETLRKFTVGLDAMFRARPYSVPSAAPAELVHLLECHPGPAGLELFAGLFEFTGAKRVVDEDVKSALHRFDDLESDGLLCEVIEMKTVSVGVVASALARRRTARAVAIGMPIGERVQFELRTADQAEFDLTELLFVARCDLVPLSAGGHPNAAGALVEAADAGAFVASLRRAWSELAS